MSREQDGRGRASRREAGGKKQGKEGAGGDRSREALPVAFDFDSHSCPTDRQVSDRSKRRPESGKMGKTATRGGGGRVRDIEKCVGNAFSTKNVFRYGPDNAALC